MRDGNGAEKARLSILWDVEGKPTIACKNRSLRVDSMFDKLEAGFNFQTQALNLRHQRQGVLANNIANADTPNFKAQDFDFTRHLKAATARNPAAVSGVRLETTSKGHIDLGSGGPVRHPDMLYRVPAQSSLDGNTVDMDRERAEFMDNSVRYQASLVMTNGYLQGLKTALQSE